MGKARELATDAKYARVMAALLSGEVSAEDLRVLTHAAGCEAIGRDPRGTCAALLSTMRTALQQNGGEIRLTPESIQEGVQYILTRWYLHNDWERPQARCPFDAAQRRVLAACRSFGFAGLIQTPNYNDGVRRGLYRPLYRVSSLTEFFDYSPQHWAMPLLQPVRRLPAAARREASKNKSPLITSTLVDK